MANDFISGDISSDADVCDEHEPEIKYINSLRQIPKFKEVIR